MKGAAEVTENPLFRPDFREVVENDFAGGPLSGGVRGTRSQSYDHCFNYFADTADLTADIEKSCAVLGFYLASWGMYRGSSYLLKYTNSTHLRPVIEYVAGHREALRAIDVDVYDDASITGIIEAYQAIRVALELGQHRHITLVTKIMVAVFGCLPAYDDYFRHGLKRVLNGRAKVPEASVTALSLCSLADVYQANRDVVDELHDCSRTVLFDGSGVSRHRLTKAKILDMYCYQLGRQQL
jgi:hypothetical protein